jgi:tetratricopeptide (TPR) repeat protein
MSLSYWIHKAQAIGLLLIGRQREALAVFGRMLERWPGDAYALASRSHLLAQQGQRAAAIEDARRLVQHHPDRSAADWFNLAYLLEGEGRCLEAEGAFRRALEMDPRLDRAWYGLGLTLIRLGRLDDAVEALKRNTELQPMSPYGWYQLAQVHMDRNEPESARKIIQHLQGFEPKVAAQLEREFGLSS